MDSPIRHHDQFDDVEIEIDEEVYKNQQTENNNKLGPLWKNKPYIFLVMSNTILYYVLSGIQYWSTYYFTGVFKMSLAQANLWFGLIAVTAPITGSLLSSLVTNFSGGYHTTKLLQMIVLLGMIGMIFSGLFPFA